MATNDLAALAIVGAAVSVLVQYIKRITFASPRLVVVILSILAGTIYYFFRDTSAWQAALQILLYASGVYVFLIKPVFED